MVSWIRDPEFDWLLAGNIFLHGPVSVSLRPFQFTPGLGVISITFRSDDEFGVNVGFAEL